MFYLCLGKLDFLHLHTTADVKFHSKVSTSGNTILHIMFKLSANQKYCQQLLDELQVHGTCAILDLVWTLKSMLILVTFSSVLSVYSLSVVAVFFSYLYCCHC